MCNAVVILDREYYRHKILDMLKDGMYYDYYIISRFMYVL